MLKLVKDRVWASEKLWVVMISALSLIVLGLGYLSVNVSEAFALVVSFLLLLWVTHSEEFAAFVETMQAQARAFMSDKD